MRGLVQGVSTVLLSRAGFEFLRSPPFFLYLCRAARGSADIPILPHAHTILLKHAVNLKRRRTLFNERTALSSPPFVSAQIALSRNYWIPPSLPKTQVVPLPCYLPRAPSCDFVNGAICGTLAVRTVALCRRKIARLNLNEFIAPFFFSLSFKSWLCHQ